MPSPREWKKKFNLGTCRRDHGCTNSEEEAAAWPPFAILDILLLVFSDPFRYNMSGIQEDGGPSP